MPGTAEGNSLFLNTDVDLEDILYKVQIGSEAHLPCYVIA